ncbi:hypothetical protein TrVE_jg8901 [Triparma verrucosa]|uniref:Cullin family profile domain-containing protein n=1 Tax=Triparma verrucosa TaxID=1606542 RepID=A0A9W7BQ90_9STRA|nr:hypothetical protein TrVE_jg8901 [Triparma verrucosa]
MLETNLIEPNLNYILGGFETVVDEKYACKGMFNMVGRVEGYEVMREAVGKWVKGKCANIIKAEKEPISSLVTFRSSVDSTWRTCFNSYEGFKTTIKSSFEESLNLDGRSNAEAMAKYVDSLQKNRKKTEGELEKELKDVMTLFRYLQDKDVFEEFYKNLLSKRLLGDKSSSVDLERFFISELKTECGSGYTGKIEGMFKDMALSDDITSNYYAHVNDKFGDSADTAVKMKLWVLTTGYWPSEKNLELILPTELQVHQRRFETYYDDKYQGRRVEWKHNLATCEVEFKLPKKSGEVYKRSLDVSCQQALTLCCFNSPGSLSGLTVSSLCKSTGIDLPSMIGIIKSLAHGKQVDKSNTTRVLKKLTKKSDSTPQAKEPKGTLTILPTDVYGPNVDFKNSRARLKILNISNRREEDTLLSQKAHDSIFRDRQHQIDAACIRIMKARKFMSHSSLVGEIMEQLKFKAENADIKKRIESLIEREYMERGEERGAYNYLA